MTESPKEGEAKLCVARSAATHSENTHKHCAFEGKILSVALKLRERGLSEAYLTTMVRALIELSRNSNLDNAGEVSLCIAKKNVKDSFKANLCDFYKNYADFCGIQFTKPRIQKRPQASICTNKGRT